jgi:hypothetical protein
MEFKNEFLGFTQEIFTEPDQWEQDFPGMCQKIFGSRKAWMIKAISEASYNVLRWAYLLRNDYGASPEQVLLCLNLEPPNLSTVKQILFYCYPNYPNMDVKSMIRIISLPWEKEKMIEMFFWSMDCGGKLENWRPNFRLRSWTQLYNHLQRQSLYLEAVQKREKTIPLSKFHALNGMEFGEF